MSQTELALLVVVVFGVVAIVVFLRFQRARVKIKGPGNLGMDVDASDPPAIRVEDAKSRKGGLSATVDDGRSIDAKKIDVEKDINLNVGRSDPKA
jgi:hypothetical protein